MSYVKIVFLPENYTKRLLFIYTYIGVDCIAVQTFSDNLERPRPRTILSFIRFKYVLAENNVSVIIILLLRCLKTPIQEHKVERKSCSIIYRPGEISLHTFNFSANVKSATVPISTLDYYTYGIHHHTFIILIFLLPCKGLLVAIDR